MLPTIPWPVTLATVVAQPVIAIAVWRVLAVQAPKTVRLALGIFLFGWLGLAVILAPPISALAGQDPYVLTPLIPLFAGISILLGLAAYGLWPALRRAAAAASLPALVGVQLYRVLGALFVVLLALGQLPAYFAEPAGWGDIFVGVTAPLVALALARGRPGARGLAIAWNIFGLLDLVVAVGMGTGRLAPYLMPSLGSHVPPAAAMGAFPMILVPTFAVPLAIMLHLLALSRLRHGARSPSPAVAMAVPR